MEKVSGKEEAVNNSLFIRWTILKTILFYPECLFFETILFRYFSNAYKDSLAEGGFTHTGGLLLIDKKRHIRGVYDGTNDLETNRLISDIRILLKE